MIESDMWKMFKSNLCDTGKICAERFEPGMPAGMGDLHWWDSTDAGWLEMKFERKKLRSAQRAFARRIVAGGGKAHIWLIDSGTSYLFSCRNLPVSTELPWQGLLMEEDADRINWNRLMSILRSGR